MTDDTLGSVYTTRPLTADTWGNFANLVEVDNGVWGGCGLVPVRLTGRAAHDQELQDLQRRSDRPAGLADRLPVHRQCHRGRGVARAAVSAALAAIEEAGGGLVEAYPEQVEGREPQRGSYLHTGPENLFESFGFERDRRIAKWRWVMCRRIQR